MFRKPLYTPTRFSIIYEPPPPWKHPDVVREGDYIVHASGSAFFVTGVTRSTKIDGRYNCRCLRWLESEIPADARVIRTTPQRTKKRRLRKEPPLLFSPRRNDVSNDRRDDDTEDDQDAGV